MIGGKVIKTVTTEESTSKPTTAKKQKRNTSRYTLKYTYALPGRRKWNKRFRSPQMSHKDKKVLHEYAAMKNIYLSQRRNCS